LLTKHRLHLDRERRGDDAGDAEVGPEASILARLEKVEPVAVG
jgi:hypothetical protein